MTVPADDRREDDASILDVIKKMARELHEHADGEEQRFINILKNNFPGESARRLVDLQLPLAWLISAAVAVLGFMVAVGWNAAVQSGKMDTLIAANVKTEKRLDERDLRLEDQREKNYATQRTLDSLAARADSQAVRSEANSQRINTLEGRKK